MDAPPSGVPGPGESGGLRSEPRADGPGLARESAAQVFARLKSLAECGDPKVELAAIKEILAWAWGKSQPQDREGDLSLAELARLLARAAGEAPEEPASQTLTGSAPVGPLGAAKPETTPEAAPPEAPALKLVRTRRKTRGA